MSREKEEKQLANNPMYRSIAYQCGVTDEVNECSCCGKRNLKRTAVFATKESWQADGGDDFIFLGSTCAKLARAASYGKIKEYTTKVDKRGRSLTLL